MVDSKTKTSHPDIVMLRTKAEAHCLDIKTRSAEINEEMKEIFDIKDDEDWIFFLTDQGVIFYNWSNYHF